jgi:PKD repeat protein
MQTTDGGDLAAVRWDERNPYTIKVRIDEETSLDSETDHTTEVVGYMAFSLTGIAPPLAAFSATETCGYDSLTVTFTDLSEGTIDRWSWDFDKDGFEDSTEQNPTYTYSDPGTYTVRLTVSNSSGSDDKVEVDLITVNVPGADLNMEVGEVSNLDHNWLTVNFSRCFVDPVVVAKPLSSNGADPSVVRMRNVYSRGFEIRVQEWDYLNDIHHVTDTVSYVVMERGSHFLSDGTQVEAGIFLTNSTSSFETKTFDQSFGVVPVVVAAVASYNETDAVTDRLQNISQVGFDFRMQEQEANAQSHSYEAIHYIAWEPGSGTVNGLEFEVATTGDTITHEFSQIVFGEPFREDPKFLADMQTTDGADPSAVRWDERNPDTIKVRIDEETSLDSETYHTTEVVGYMAFSVGD